MEFVPFEIAKKFKENGFQEECLCHYIGDDLIYNIESPIANNQLWFCHNKYDNIWHRDNIDALTISQALDWLREEKGIHVGIVVWERGWYYDAFSFEYNEEELEYEINGRCVSKNYKSYKEAALAGIEYVLDNLI